MGREKRDVKELKERAINSLMLGIELFNRPSNKGRPESVLILLHHSFEMLLKAIIKNKTGNVFSKGNKYTYSFDQCLEICKSKINSLSNDERVTLSILDAYRDTCTHYYQYISEDMLYVQAQSSVTLFNDLLTREFGIRLSTLLPERILPISTNPPKDIQLLLKSELSHVDWLLKAGRRTDIQATARLRSIVAFATAGRDNSERISESYLRKAIRRRKNGEDWGIIFPEVAQLRFETTGEGIVFSLRIKKEGLPVRYAEPGEEALCIKPQDWFDKYNLTIDDLASKLNVTVPKVRAYMHEMKIWENLELYGEKRIKSHLYKRYTQKALVELRQYVQIVPEAEVWMRHKDKVLGRKAPKTN